MDFKEHYVKLCDIVQEHSKMIELLNETIHRLNENTMEFIKKSQKADKELLELLKKE